MIYFYARVSTKEQSLERQIKAARETGGIDLVYSDKESGKNFERPQYQAMKKELKKGDTVVVKELDRLGRDKDLVKAEIQWYKDNGVRLKILNIPSTLIDFKDQAWIGDMVNNILIEVLSTIAEEERRKTRERQAEGIAAMPIVHGKHISARTGRGFGGQEMKPVPDFLEAYNLVKAGELGTNKAIKALGISPAKWYRMVKYHEWDLEHGEIVS